MSPTFHPNHSSRPGAPFSHEQQARHRQQGNREHSTQLLGRKICQPENQRNPIINTVVWEENQNPVHILYG